jgi:hypothetical protein
VGAIVWFLTIRRRQRRAAADRVLDDDGGTQTPLS